MADDPDSRGIGSAEAPARPIPSGASHLQALVDQTAAGIAETDLDGRFVNVNDRYCRIVGRSRDDLLGTQMQDITHPDDLPRNLEQFRLLLETGKAFEIEKRYLCPNGSATWVTNTVSLVRDLKGRPVSVLAVTIDSSDRKAAESALRESEERFRAMADSAPSPTWVTNSNGVEFVNRAFCEFTGLSPSELMGDAWTKLIHPEDLPAILERRSTAWQNAEPYGFEARFKGADGSWRDMRVSSRPQFGADGQLLGYVGMAVEITDIRAAEAALKESEARFRTLYEGAGIGMLEIDTDWHILGANAAYARIAGRPEDALTGVDCLSFTHPDDLDRSQQAMSEIQEGQSYRVSFEKRYMRPDGQIVWIRSTLSRVSSAGGTPRFLKIVEDITEFSKAREALREESQNLEILNRVGSAIAAELDLEAVVQLVTDAGVDMTGAQFGAFFYNVTDADGESYTLYTLSGADRADFEGFPMPRNTAVFGPTFEGLGIVRSDDITQDPRYGKNAPYKGMPEGHLPVRSYLAVPVRGRSGNVIGGLFFGHPEPGRFDKRHETLMVGMAAQAAIAIDNAQLFRAAQREIENRMKAEQAVRMLNETLESRVAEEVDHRARSEEALQQLQKMETIGQLSGGIAHDFNNLLQVIHGNLSMIQKAAGDGDPKLKRWTNNALLGAERAAALTQRLLAFSRRQPLAPRAVDSNRLIEGMAELLQRTLSEAIGLQTDLQSGLWLAEVDPNQLENALLNLAVNARDAMPDGGRLTIETTNCGLDGDVADCDPELEPGEYVCIAVSDDGTGMDAETIERALEPFFTTKDVGKGTGLGLPMVYGFARQSGGDLRIYSEPGVGTTAKIYLPRHVGPGKHVEEARPQGEVKRGRGETILLCEDDAEVRSFAAETLAQLGYQVIEAIDASEAMAALRESDRIDLLFTDVILPGGVTGPELAGQAQAIRPGLKVLYTSGYARSALDRQGRLQPGVELILKPYFVPELASRLRTLLD